MPIFREQKHGVIINVSSIVGRFGVPFISPYCAGKFAIEGLSESLYYELAPPQYTYQARGTRRDQDELQDRYSLNTARTSQVCTQ